MCWSVQYPKGLGSTVSELQVEHAAGLFPKTKFSMVVPEVEKLMSRLCNGNVKHVVLFGIEVTRSQNILILCLCETTTFILQCCKGNWLHPKKCYKIAWESGLPNRDFF